MLDAAFWPVANADTVARAAMLFAIVPTRMLAIGDPEVTGWGSFDGWVFALSLEADAMELRALIAAVHESRPRDVAERIDGKEAKLDPTPTWTGFSSHNLI